MPTVEFTIASSLDDQYMERSSSGTEHPPAGPISRDTASAIVSNRKSRQTNDVRIYRNGLLRWDTSSLPDDAIIESAILRVYVSSKANDGTGIYFTAGWYDWSGSSSSDYTAFVETNAIPGTAVSGIPTGQVVDFTLSNAASNVSKTGFTRIRTHIDYVTLGGSGSHNYLYLASFDNLGGLPAPKLVVQYRLPSQTITPSLVFRTPQAYQPTLSPGEITVEPPFTARTTEVFSPENLYSGVSIEGPFIVRDNPVFSPELLVGGVEIGTEFVDRLWETFEPEFTIGGVSIHVPLTDGGRTVFLIGVGDLRLLETKEEKARLLVVRRVLSGFFGPVQMRTKIHVSNATGDDLGVLETVRRASVDLSNFRDTTWGLSLEMDRDPDLDPLSDWVKVVAEVRLPDGWREFPLGLYRFKSPSGSHLRSKSVWNLSGFSAELVPLEDSSRSVYTVPKNSMILGTVKNILLARGMPEEMIDLPMGEDRRLATAQVFDPFSDESSASWLRIINALLNAGAFAALYTDRMGRFRTQRFKDMDSRGPAVYYGPREDEEPVVLDGVGDDWDSEMFANAIVVSSEDPNQQNPITAVAENDDPNSAASFTNLGRWVVKHVKMQTIADQASADLMARVQLQAASGFYRKLSWSTPPDPERGPKESYSIFIPREDEDDVEGIFSGISWSMEVHPHPKEISFEGSKVEVI